MMTKSQTEFWDAAGNLIEAIDEPCAANAGDLITIRGKNYTCQKSTWSLDQLDYIHVMRRNIVLVPA